jgi:hypothetical protein
MITYKPMNNYESLAGTSNTGLCNQMFQVASTIGIAVKHGYDWSVPRWVHPFSGVFYLHDKGMKVVKVPWGYHDIEIKDNRSLNGYMQSERYFDHCSELIRGLFSFKERLVTASNFISVHVRRGDYNKDHHTLLGREYYDKALSLLPSLPVYVFTDAPQVAKEVVPSYDQLFYGDPFYDLNLMTHASHHVIANSSFSWWGAWLANAGTVVAPKIWFGPKKSKWDTKDIYCKGWRVIC